MSLAASPAEVDGAALLGRLRAALSGANSNAQLVHRARYLCASCLIEIDGHALGAHIDAGSVQVLEQWRPLTHWTSAFRASALAWQHYWRSPPSPGWHEQSRYDADWLDPPMCTVAKCARR